MMYTEPTCKECGHLLTDNGSGATCAECRPDFTQLTGPPEGVTDPGDCPAFGRELPASWLCPPGCVLAAACYAAYENNT